MKKLILTASLIALMVFAFAACGEKKVSAEEILEITLSGIDGEGELYVTKDYKFATRLAMDIKGKDFTDYDDIAFQFLFSDGIEIEEDGDLDGLSNGDKITFRLTYAKDAFKEAGVIISPDEFTYTVEGLKEPIEFDPFSGVTLNFGGISPKGYLTEINSEESPDMIKENVRFTTEVWIGEYGTAVANGDEIEIKASLMGGRKEFVDDNGDTYRMKTDTKTFTVSGLPEYIKNPASIDFSEVTDELNKQADEIIKKKYIAGETWYTVEMLGSGSGNLSDTWQIDSVNVTRDSGYFWSPKPESGTKEQNTYTAYYLVTLNMTKTRNASHYATKKDGNDVGDVRSFTIPLVVYAHNIAENNGTLDLSNTNYKYMLYNRYDYVSPDVAGVIDHWINNNPDWNYEKIN
jgi:hypothetical protein